MKILMIDALVGSDYSECLCSGLKDAGSDIVLIVPENKPIQRSHNFPILKWSPSKQKATSKIDKINKIYKYVRYLVKVVNYIKQNKIVIVHYQFFRRKSEILFYCFLKLCRVKLIYTSHNVVPHENSRYDYRLQRLVLQSSTGIIAHTTFIKNKLLEYFSIAEEKIHVIAHGNYDSYLPDKLISKRAARTYFQLKKNDNVVLFFGAIKAYKGLDLLLQAFAIAATQNNNLKLLIAGEADSSQLKNDYLNKIKQIGLTNRIIHHFNYIPAELVANYFLAADIVALPYKNIYHSGIVHLAFSFARPIIATKAGDFEEMTEQGKCGFISPQNTADDFAKTILTGFSGKHHLEKMGKYCKQVSESKYSWKNIAQKTKNFYESFVV